MKTHQTCQVHNDLYMYYIYIYISGIVSSVCVCIYIYIITHQSYSHRFIVYISHVHVYHVEILFLMWDLATVVICGWKDCKPPESGFKHPILTGFHLFSTNDYCLLTSVRLMSVRRTNRTT